jgi:hypothetical protein
MIRLYFWTYFFTAISLILFFLAGGLLGYWLISDERKIYKINKMIKKYKDIDLNKIFLLIRYEIEKYKILTKENPSKIYMTRELFELLTAYNTNLFILDGQYVRIFGIPISIDTQHRGFYYCIGGHDGEIEIEEENEEI